MRPTLRPGCRRGFFSKSTIYRRFPPYHPQHPVVKRNPESVKGKTFHGEGAPREGNIMTTQEYIERRLYSRAKKKGVYLYGSRKQQKARLYAEFIGSFSAGKQ